MILKIKLQDLILKNKNLFYSLQSYAFIRLYLVKCNYKLKSI